MLTSSTKTINISLASEHNLQNISLEIPHNQLIVVTGVSGSGKSSLAFDVIAKEGQRRFLETFSSFSRQFMGKISRPKVESVEGLSAVITLSQKTVGSGSRSTVGTMSDLYDLLRLLYARLGEADPTITLSRSLFSFNTPVGACPHCDGLGLEEKISIEKLIAHPEKTLREGALAPSLPNGYIMYSQVTLDVLNQVCQAHGFTVDIPWNDLTAENKEVVLFGSTRIKVPFGKHPLESRLKWTGITAKPREEGYYRGLVPIMTEILHRDRNENILRYAESVSCHVCEGKRLNKKALSVRVKRTSIDVLAAMEISELKTWLSTQTWEPSASVVAEPIVHKMVQQISMLEKLGVGHLSLNRTSQSLSAGESQRIRLVNQVYAELSHVLYVFDEPTVGLHPAEKQPMLDILRMLVNKGNTVIVVEHDESTVRQSDWIIDIGPAAGEAGGKLLFNGPIQDFLSDHSLIQKSPTYDALHSDIRNTVSPLTDQSETSFFFLKGCQRNNLKNIDVQFRKGAFNVVTGVSGAGKASLVHGILEKVIVDQLSGTKNNPTRVGQISGIETIDKLITINQSPIGRTPRSNPATYTGWADKLRDLFSRLEESKKAGFTKSTFSFNTAGGRCETCQGAGSLQIGMHFLGNVDVICPECNGKRFHEDTLQIKYNGKNISEVLDLSVEHAIVFFSDQPSLLKQLKILAEVGLGYLRLGQASSTLSGGEAQRIKLATELQQADTGNTLYLLDEPTIGLHITDIEVLVTVLRRLIRNGNTVICIEHDTDIIRQADWVVDLGPGSGARGGDLVFQGSPARLLESRNSLTARGLRGELGHLPSMEVQPSAPAHIRLYGVTTHQLKNVDVSIPLNKLTVITGVSGSGKSSLAFDTLFAEARGRFSESLSSYARTLLKQSNPARLINSSGLGPVVAINRKYLGHSSRSTVGTITGLYDHYRLLYSRLSYLEKKDFTAGHFSFNHQLGACPECDGLGIILTCDPEKLITHPVRSILQGAMDGHKPGKFYGDPNGQYIATVKEVAGAMNLDLTVPWNQLDEKSKEIILYGTEDIVWDVNWEFKNKTRSGIHRMKSKWPGCCNLVNDEYQRTHLNKNTRDIENLLKEQPCNACQGTRLKSELLEIQCYGKNIATLSALPFTASLSFFEEVLALEDKTAALAIISEISRPVMDLLKVLQELGLSYLSADRSSATLSGGEGQRLRLAGAFSARLYGVTYVLDEPTIGLHNKDVIPLIKVIKRLIVNGNTVVVVEHDETFIRHADHIIEMGPGAGRLGGEITATGTVEEITGNQASITGQYLRHPFTAWPVSRKYIRNSFGIRGATKNNLKKLDISFIAKGIIAVTGISGSGKSSLVNEVLGKSALLRRVVGCEETYGLDQFDRIVSIDQQPVTATSLSTPATFSGLMDELRELFAETPRAKELLLKKSAFSYLHKDGKCADCNGYGQKKTSMDFMSDIWVPCDSCQGSRYSEEPLQCRIDGKSIADVFAMTVDEAIGFIGVYPKIYPYLAAMKTVGIGHLQLGQAGNTLSGGESQRLKLASELIHHRTGHNLYLFDEPTTGLHTHDIRNLIAVFNQLADEGHTLLFIEHNPVLIAIANQLIELGPGSGPAGGEIVSDVIKP